MDPSARRLLSMGSGVILVITVLFLVAVPQELRSQIVSQAMVKGRVVDDSTGSPLPLADVFVSNSTIGTATNTEGSFKLRGVPLGNQEIVASIVGYVPQTKMLRLIDTTMYEVEFRLRPQAVQIQGVEVQAKEPTEWKKNLQRFLKEFLGSTPNAEQCKVLNPEVLDFAMGGTGLFTATARAPLEIENRTLGYRIRCYLDYFSSSEKPMTTLSRQSTGPVPTPTVSPSDAFSNSTYAPPPAPPDFMVPAAAPTTIELLCRTKFTALESKNQKELAQWKENRRKTYFGSMRHFLTSLVQKRPEREGFKVYDVYRTRSSSVPTLRMKVAPDTLPHPGEFSFERTFFFTNLLQIIYDGGDETQTSWMRLSRPAAVFYTNGMLPDPLSITTYGYWATERVADWLPIDYRPDE
jgi:hypothetical protein